MSAILSGYFHFAAWLERQDWLLPFLARFIFAAVLMVYFWTSATTKHGEGLLGLFDPSSGAYAQIFPKTFEAVGYNSSKLGQFHWLVAVGATIGEFLLPFLILVGLFTRLSALGMMVFITVQSLTDLFGHGGIAHAETLGAWFDRFPDGAILDQRALWMLLLTVLLIKGGGPVSMDRLLLRNAP